MGLDISKEINNSQSGQKIVILQIAGEPQARKFSSFR